MRDAFAETDLPIFQSLADNIAVAIDNARLVEQTDLRLIENQQLVEQMRRAVKEVERLNQELTSRVWSEYLAGREDELALTLDLIQHKTERTADWTPALSEAVQENDLVQTRERSTTTVAVPLRVRGQVIGAMEFEIEGGELTSEDIELLQTVGERLGLALEGARLYGESRRVAHREAMLNEIGGRLQSSNNVGGVLTEAARSLQTSLGAQRVAIRLGTPHSGNGGQRENGTS
jgi:GAF domain-containing protein